MTSRVLRGRIRARSGPSGGAWNGSGGIAPAAVIALLLATGCGPGGAERAGASEDTRAAGGETAGRGDTSGAAGLPGPQAARPGEWPVYGGDPGGARYSPLDRIDRDNVASLEVAWTYQTGELAPEFATRSETSLEVTPLVVDGTLYVSTPLGRVIALDPATGEERWLFDPEIDRSVTYGDFTNRGVSTWLDPEAADGDPCRRRVYIAVIDGRLIALDGRTGTPCPDFGDAGTVNLEARLRIPPFETAAYQITSPPAVVNGRVVVGSAIADNSRIAPASGEVRAFDARTGTLLWSWDPVPQDPADPAHGTWGGANEAQTGAANAWSVIVADPERDLVFVPTSSPAPDYYGGLRKGENRYANSVVALRAADGTVAWHFQTVHHDLWDYDNASPPALVELERDGRRVPAVLQATKTGMLFVLHRETGEPLFPVEERPVPASDVEGEEAWPTQPFTAAIAPLSPHRFDAADVWGVSEEDRAACRRALEGARNEGIFTPPSLEGTVAMPSNIGGAHWGGVAFDPARQIAVVPVNRIAALVQLFPAEDFDRDRLHEEGRRLGEDWETTHMRGSPYIMRRRIFTAPSGLPCTPPPFGTLLAVNLGSGEKAWEVPLGTLPSPETGERGPEEWGSPNLGGPLVTAGGLVFIGATLDRSFRAYDVETGEELWRADLPAGGKATPMTWLGEDGRQYVAIAAGGGGRFGDGDAVVAFGHRPGS